MTVLLDVNVLVAIAWPNHVHHVAARSWFADKRFDGWHTSSLTQSGFIRISSNQRSTPDARTPMEAGMLLSKLCALPEHSFVPDSVDLLQGLDEFPGVVNGNSQVTDFHLILIARSVNAHFVTFDRAAATMSQSMNVASVLLTL